MLKGFNYTSKSFRGKNKKQGITLVALVITVIILLILAGTAISIGLNEGELFGHTNNSVERYNEKVAEESNITEYLEYLEKIGWKDPAEEYGYGSKEGVVDAKDLEEGDIINYYYDKEKEPIPCAVIYNDKKHGLQIVTLNSVGNVILGCDVDKKDSKAIEAFKDEIPDGYFTDYDNLGEDIWSYNHAFQTLKMYAMEYMGYMAKNARCLGAPDTAAQEENELTNMYTINENYTYFLRYDKKLKNEDEWDDAEELNKMKAMEIMQTNDSTPYWIASRKITQSDLTVGTSISFKMCYINESGEEKMHSLFGIGYIKDTNKIMISLLANEFGLRPIFTLRDYIKVEKIGNLN